MENIQNIHAVRWRQYLEWGNCARERKLWAQAESLFRQALRLAQQSDMNEKPEMAFTISCLADLYNARGQYEMAEELYKHVLVIYEKTLGTRHANVGLTLHQLAEICHNQGKKSEETVFRRRALDVLIEATSHM